MWTIMTSPLDVAVGQLTSPVPKHMRPDVIRWHQAQSVTVLLAISGASSWISRGLATDPGGSGTVEEFQRRCVRRWRVSGLDMRALDARIRDTPRGDDGYAAWLEALAIWCAYRGIRWAACGEAVEGPVQLGETSRLEGGTEGHWPAA